MEVSGQSETKGDKKQGWDASSHLGPRVDVLATGHSGGKPGSAGVSDLRTRVRCVVAEAVRPTWGTVSGRPPCAAGGWWGHAPCLYPWGAPSGRGGQVLTTGS